MTWSGCRSVAGIVVLMALAVASPAAASGGGGTPLPHVTGPLPVTATSYPFGAADHTLVPEDLSKVGYVEDEYLVVEIREGLVGGTTANGHVVTRRDIFVALPSRRSLSPGRSWPRRCFPSRCRSRAATSSSSQRWSPRWCWRCASPCSSKRCIRPGPW